MKGFLWCPYCRLPHALSTIRCPTTGEVIDMGIPRAERGHAPGALIAKRYRVLRLGTEESAGLVYDAKHVETHRRVWVKVVHEDELPRAEREAEILEMEREARAASLVDHPNVSSVLDFERLGVGEAFLVRERNVGSSLAALLRTDGVLETADAADILSQILSGLHALHLAGVVHRDLGCHNVIIVPRVGCRPVAKIGGLGRCSAPKLGDPPDAPSGVHYSSPELLVGDAVDQRSDLFACGVILFEMLTGRRPFEGPSPDDVRRAILGDDRPSAAILRPILGAEWLDVIEKALDKDPARRHESALAFQSALPSPARRRARLRLSMTNDDSEGTDVQITAATPDGQRSRTGANGPSKCDPYIGRRIADKYLLESLLGSGSTGAVYKGMHVGLRRPVAVKLLHDRNRRASNSVERFKAEALVAGRLDHPNIARILDSGEEADGTLYLVMEYLEGTTLEALISTEVRLPPERATKLAIQLASSLVVAHAAGVIHRDVKPENIIVVGSRDENGRPTEVAKVCDFGLAKLHDREGGSADLTGVGVILGSPVYISPEQIRGIKCDADTDLYAAAVTLYEMLSGRLPHEADTVVDLFKKKLTEPPTRLSIFLPDVDELLEDIVMRALDVDPTQRHASALELQTELVVALEQLSAPPVSIKNTVSIWPERA